MLPGLINLLDPGAQETLEELDGFRVLNVAAERMNTHCSATKGIVAQGASTNGD